MDFFVFCATANEVFQSVPKNSLYRFQKKPYHPSVEASIFCFKKLFSLPIPTHLTIINDTHLDFDTIVDIKNPKTIIVQQGQEAYAFLPNEISDIMHNDLNSSSVELMEAFKLCTLTRSFRLPRNPYTNKTFTLAQLNSIIQQMVLQHTLDDLFKFPEVAIFILHREQFNYDLQDHYMMTNHIINIFETHGLIFIQNYKYNHKSHQCDNQSEWTYISKINTKIWSQLLFGF